MQKCNYLNCVALLAVWNHKNGTLNYSIPTSSAGNGIFYMISNSSGGWFAVTNPSQLNWAVATSYVVSYTVRTGTMPLGLAVLVWFDAFSPQ